MVGLKAWVSDSDMFGVRREFKLELPTVNMTVIGDPFVSDYRTRGWFERWFSRPWRPFVKVEKAPYAYSIKDENSDHITMYVSVNSFLELEQMETERQRLLDVIEKSFQGEPCIRS